MTKFLAKSKRKTPPPWSDRECQVLIQRKYSILFVMLCKFRLSNMDVLIFAYINIPQFKQKFKLKKQLYHKDRRQELFHARKDPRKF